MDEDRGRWDRLFADLEGEFAAAERAELLGETADRTRHEAGLLTVSDRLRAARGQQIVLRVRGVGDLRARLVDIGPDWLLVSEDGARDVVLPLAAVLAIGGLGPGSLAGPPGLVARRLDFRYVLRGLVRDRAAVRLVLSDGLELAGTLDRVGGDFVELAEHAAGEPRRAGAVRAVRTIPLGALAAVRVR